MHTDTSTLFALAMRKLFLLLCTFFVIGGVFWLLPKNEQPIKPPIIESKKEAAQEDQTTIGKELPTRLVIPKLNVDAFVESVGMDNKGRMDVPKDDNNVAWYNLGFSPGQKGSAVFAGHFDNKSGGPAVFHNLSTLENGDEITAYYPDGKTYTFVVTQKTEYNFDQVPLEEVFNSQDQPRLNLITCDGVFDKNARNYSKRLVVYSVLKP